MSALTNANAALGKAKLALQGTIRNTAVGLGDSRVQLINNDYPSNYSLNAQSCMVWAGVLLGQKLNIVANLGVSGERTDQYMARIGQALAFRPQFLFLWGAVNDITQSYPTATTCGATAAANVITCIIAAAQQGTIPVVFSEAGTTTLSTATQRKQVNEYNDRVAEAARTYGGLFFDEAGCVLDKTSSSIAFITGASAGPADPTHRSNYGGYLAGVKLAALLSPFVGGVINQPHSLWDINASNPNQLLANPLLTGTTGSVPTGTTGSLPTSYTGARTGTPTCAASLATNADGFGQDLTLAITSTAASDLYLLKQDCTLTGVVAGDVIDFQVEAALSGLTNCYGFDLVCDLNYTLGGTTSSRTARALYQLAAAVPQPLTANHSGVWAGRIVVPAFDVLNWISWRAETRFAGAGGATVVLRRAAVRKRYS